MNALKYYSFYFPPKPNPFYLPIHTILILIIPLGLSHLLFILDFQFSPLFIILLLKLLRSILYLKRFH